MSFSERQIAAPPIPEALPEKTVTPPKESLEVTEKLDELEDLPEDTEIDISPEIDENKFAIEADIPAVTGDDLGDILEPVKGPDVNDVPDIGRTNELFENPIGGEIKVDPGQAMADIFDPDAFTKQLIKKGAGGKAKDGVLEGFTTLKDMKKLSGNALENATALLGSDLLFEYNKADLKDSARNSLMAVAFLIDKNPNMFCVLDGHTDLFGNDKANYELSLRRAEAVKKWLVSSLMLDEKRIIVRGYGKAKPIVKQGTADEQAINRRVEIKMRSKRPTEMPGPPQKAIVVKPNVPRPDPVKPEPVKPEPVEPIEKPQTVEPVPVLPKAEPVKPDPQKAIPVKPDPKKAVPVGPRRVQPVEPQRAEPVQP